MGRLLVLLALALTAGCGDNLRGQPVPDDAAPDAAVDAAPVTDCTGKPDDTACNDMNACTQTDRCAAGVCVGANPVTCTAADSCHVAGVCDPTSGTCSNPSAPNGTTCDDDNTCTRTDTCVAGACVGANPAPTGTSCNDADACTQTDACSAAGICTGGNAVTCTAQDACHVAGVCDPTNGTCSNPVAVDGTTCSDGDACTQLDSCVAGACTGSNPKICDASDDCHVAGTCDPATGVCSNPPAVDGTGCSDGNACTLTDSCSAGACIGTNPKSCAASDACHVAGTCNPADGMCSDPPAPNGTSCSDGSACTQNDICQAGTCGGAAVVCPPPDQCHGAPTCDAVNGCVYPMLANGTSCDDGSACTTSDSCTNGTCGGTAVVCTASDQCHVAGVCDPSSGVCSDPVAANGTGCNDGDGCTQTDACSGGACVGDNPVVCTATACNTPGTCNPASGTCSAPQPVANGSPCSDSNACTTGDACVAGSCTGGSPIVCTPSDQCHTAGTCDPAMGCSNPALANGTFCNDGNPCTSNDACTSGVCGGPMLADGTSCGEVTTCVAGNCTCGNGVVEPTEECDDSNPTPCDSCGPTCKNELNHSYVASVPTNGVSIPDGAYDGSVSSMGCVNVSVPSVGDGLIDYVCAQTGVDHPWIGDLVMKVVHGARVVTLMNRPGTAEADDAGGPGGLGFVSALASTNPISFYDGAPYDAELAGSTLVETVCRDDAQCEFHPNAGSATPGTLAGFSGEPAAGTWRLCVGDVATPDAGSIQSLRMTVVQ